MVTVPNCASYGDCPQLPSPLRPAFCVDVNILLVRDMEFFLTIGVNQLRFQKFQFHQRQDTDLNRMLCRRWSELLDGRLFRWERAGYETPENQHLLTGERIWDTIPLDRWMHTHSDLPPIHVINQHDELAPSEEHVLFSVNGGKIRPGIPTKLQPDDDKWLVYDLSPAEQHTEHLKHLSGIARLIGTESQRQRILQAREPEGLFKIISLS